MGIYWNDTLYYGNIITEAELKKINSSDEGDKIVKKYVIKRSDGTYLIGIRVKCNIKRYNTNIENICSADLLQFINNRQFIPIEEIKIYIRNYISYKEQEKELNKPDIVKFIHGHNGGTKKFKDDDNVKFIFEDDDIEQIKKEYIPISKCYHGEPKWIDVKEVWDTYGM